MTLKELLDKIHPETQELVEAAKATYNDAIRHILRDEMALRLIKPEKGRTRAGRKHPSVSVPVKVKPGAPVGALERVDLKGVDDLDLLLGRYRSNLKRLSDACLGVEALIGSLHEHHLLSCPENELLVVRGWADLFLQRIRENDPLARILDYDEDMLGVYTSTPGPSGFFSPETPSGSITLFWGVIGLSAQTMGCTVEDLTIVILAHELAHAYTHMGADIDGMHWNTVSFQKSDRQLKEGLAQYYTYRTCQRLQLRAPGAMIAYKELLIRQPPPYLTHLRWLDEHSSPEHIRGAMIATRRNDVGTLRDFEALLNESRVVLGNATTDTDYVERE